MLLSWGLMLHRAVLGWTEHWKPFRATSSFNHEHLWQVCTFPADHGWSLFLPPPTKQDVFTCINSVCDQDWIQICSLFGLDTLLTWFLRLRPRKFNSKFVFKELENKFDGFSLNLVCVCVCQEVLSFTQLMMWWMKKNAITTSETLREHPWCSSHQLFKHSKQSIQKDQRVKEVLCYKLELSLANICHLWYWISLFI